MAYNREQYLARREIQIAASKAWQKKNYERYRQNVRNWRKSQSEESEEVIQKQRIRVNDWYQRNREIVLAKRRKYRTENREAFNKAQAKYYQKNRDKILAYHKAYYLKQKLKDSTAQDVD